MKHFYTLRAETLSKYQSLHVCLELTWPKISVSITKDKVSMSTGFGFIILHFRYDCSYYVYSLNHNRF